MLHKIYQYQEITPSMALSVHYSNVNFNRLL